MGSLYHLRYVGVSKKSGAQKQTPIYYDPDYKASKKVALSESHMA